jgi:IS1 family transposase
VNTLSTAKRVAIVRCLVEGNSIRATSRMTGICKEAIMRLLCLLGPACEAHEHQVLRNLVCQRVQADEIWSFVGCKEGNLSPAERGQGRGDCWTWTVIDADTKLMVCWHVGLRETRDADLFMEKLASRIQGRTQLTTDGLRAYRGAVENAFGSDVDYATAIKTYARPLDDNRIEARYSASRCKEVSKHVIFGSPDPDHISTSHNERCNLTMRMHMRRFTRLTNAFSKKVENHRHSVALHMMWYNFCRIHQTLRVTPAMAAGVSDHVWEIEEVVRLIDQPFKAVSTISGVTSSIKVTGIAVKTAPSASINRSSTSTFPFPITNNSSASKNG